MRCDRAWRGAGMVPSEGDGPMDRAARRVLGPRQALAVAVAFVVVACASPTPGSPAAPTVAAPSIAASASANAAATAAPTASPSPSASPTPSLDVAQALVGKLTAF